MSALFTARFLILPAFLLGLCFPPQGAIDIIISDAVPV